MKKEDKEAWTDLLLLCLLFGGGAAMGVFMAVY